VCAGAVSRSALGRLPVLRRRIRWVKSSTISTASRAANSLGSGTPVRDWTGLAGASVVLIQAPDATVSALVEEMAAAELAWSGRSVVLLDSSFGSGVLRALERQGAAPASLNWLGSPPDRFLLEGDESAVRQVRSLLKQRGTEVIEIRRDGKADYLCGVRQATDRFVPLLAATVEHFMRAGMNKSAAEMMARSLVEGSVRAYFRAGKRLLRRPAPLVF
jgi:predicted short-subunit dehydrogenase-like oxidoreductase (DUF2520 family)